MARLTDEELNNIAPDAVDELARIEKMTPDEALQESMQRNPDASLTDAQRAAALIPPDEMQRRRAAASPAPAAAPASALAPAPLDHTIGGDGKSRTAYGGKVLVVDQKTGAVSWENPDETAADAPGSVRMAERGGTIDDPEFAQWRNQALFNSKTLEQRKKMAGERNHLLAETAAQTLEQLNDGQGAVKSTKDGRRFRIVMFKNDGEDNPVTRLNRMNADMGRGGNMTSISAAVEIDADGNAIGKPIIKYGRSDGGKGKATAFRDLDIGEVMNRWADTYAEKTGQTQLEARRRAVERFGGDANLAGRNPAGWDIAPTVQEKAAEEQRRFNEQQKLKQQEADTARQKVDNQDAQFYAELGFNKDKLDESIRQFDKTFGLDEKKYNEAVREFDASLDQKAREAADKLGVRKMEILANAGATVAHGGGKREFLSALPREFVKSYIDAEIPELDDDGKPMLDEVTGKPMYRKPTTEEMRQRYAELESLAKQAYGAASGDAYVNNLVTVLDGDTARPAQAAQSAQPARNDASSMPSVGAMNGATDAQPQTQGGAMSVNITSAGAAEALARRRAQQNGGGAAANPAGDLAKPAVSLGVTQNGALMQPTKTSDEIREESRLRRRAKAMSDSGADEDIVSHYESINPETMKRFRNAQGADVTEADIYSGKYDQALRNFAEIMGDTSTPNVIDQIAAFRSEGQASKRSKAAESISQSRESEYNEAMARIRADAERNVAMGNLGHALRRRFRHGRHIRHAF